MIGREARGNWTLIGLLVAVLVIGVLLYIVLGIYLKSNERAMNAIREGQERAGAPKNETPIEYAKGEQCRNNLDQIRKAIQIAGAMSMDEQHPPNLQALSSQGITSDMLVCPVGKEPYRYDPQTGRVWCIHPGHEKF